MAACGSLEHIFDNPLSEPPSSFLESLSPWKHLKSMKQPLDDSSFTEIFGELHFKENHIHPSPESSPNSTFWDDPKDNNFSASYNHPSKSKQYGSSDTFSCKNSESLSLCTEGLGFESFDDVEDLLNHDNKEWGHQEAGEKSVARNSETEHHRNESKISSRTSSGDFPPPISCIGRSGKPWVCFKSYREDGRFILKEIRIPTQEFLHACRENGRLKLHFIHSESDDEILVEEEEDQEKEEQIDDDNDDDQERDWNEREMENNVENRGFDLQSSS